MRRIKNILLFSIAATMVACSADDALDNIAQQSERQGHAVPIVLSASSDITRASTLLLSDLVGKDVSVFFQAMGDGGTITPTLTNDHATFAVGSLSAAVYPLTCATTYYKSANATGVKAYAIYPTTAAPSAYDGTASITVSTAQNEDANYEASDLCHASEITLTAGETAMTGSLDFRHLMAKLIVTIPSSPQNIKKVELLGVRPTLSFTPSTYTYNGESLDGLTASGDATDITLYSHDTGEAVASYACVFPPQEVAVGNFIRITLADDTSGTYNLGSAKTFYPCRSYTYNLTIANNS